MSDHDEVMERLNWLVEANKKLLVMLAGYTPSDDLPLELDPDLDDPEVQQLAAKEVNVERPGNWCPASPTGTHTGQKLLRGNLVCANCEALLVANTGSKAPGQRAPWLDRVDQ